MCVCVGKTDGHDLAPSVGCRRKGGETEEGKYQEKDHIIISVGQKTKRETGIIEGCDLGHDLEWLVHSRLFLLHFLVFLCLSIQALHTLSLKVPHTHPL